MHAALRLLICSQQPPRPPPARGCFPRPSTFSWAAALGRSLGAGLALGELLTATGDPLAAEQRLQQTADVAATHRFFADTALALDLIAKLQETSGRNELAAKNRALAAQARSFAVPR
jgi:hypothetical protein